MERLNELVSILTFPLCVCSAIVAASYLIWAGIESSDRWTEQCLKSGQSIVAGNCLPIRTTP